MATSHYLNQYVKWLLIINEIHTNTLEWYFKRHLKIWFNKANLRDLIAATGLVISNWIQIVNFSARVTVKFDGWPCKTIGHLFYATSSFVYHFIPIGEFKLKLQSGNAQFGSKSTIFLAVWPRNFTDDPKKHQGISFMLLQALCSISYPLVNSNWSYSPETPNLGQIQQFLEPCDLIIWRMTLNKANLRDLKAATGL